MKKLLVFGLLIAALVIPNTLRAQSQEMQQLILNIEKLAQFRKILKDMKKGYEILTNGYNTVKDITEGNFNLHKAFLDALYQVSPAVRNYKKVGDIMSCQVTLVEEYRQALDLFRARGDFNEQEIHYLENVYDNLLNQSLRNLEELTGVLTAGSMRMSDDERLQAIDRIYADMEDKLLFLRSFNNSTGLLALQRAKDANDVQSMRHIYRDNN